MIRRNNVGWAYSPIVRLSRTVRRWASTPTLRGSGELQDGRPKFRPPILLALRRIRIPLRDSLAASAYDSLSPVPRGEGRGEGLFGELRHLPNRPSPQPSPLSTGERE